MFLFFALVTLRLLPQGIGYKFITNYYAVVVIDVIRAALI